MKKIRAYFCSLILIFVLTSCASRNKYDRQNGKVILGRITVTNDDVEYDFTQLINSNIKSFIRQPKVPMNPFKEDTRGNGLVVGNAYTGEYKISTIEGKDNNFSFKANFPPIYVKIGEARGIYYFGHIKLFYVGGKLRNIKLVDNQEKDLKAAKSYIDNYKELAIVNLVPETQKQVERIVGN